MTRNKLHLQKHLTLESLEERRLFAGDVSVGLSAGNLVVSGDGQSNAIEIRQYSNGHLRIESEDGGDTTVNGGWGVTISQEFSSLIVELGGGNDYLYLHNTIVNRDVDIDFGLGRDNMDLSSLMIRDDLLIDFGDDPSWIGTEYGSIVNVDVGSSISNNDLYIEGNEASQNLYLFNINVDDDLDLLLTDDTNESDYVSITNVAAFGESGDARFRIHAASIVGSELENDHNPTGDIAFAYVGKLDVDEVYAGDDIWIDGRDDPTRDDDLRLETTYAGDRIRMRGFRGNDTLVYTSGQDVELLGGDGDDHLSGGNGRDILLGGNGNDALMGWRNVDLIKGEAGHDRILRTPNESVDNIYKDWLDTDVNFANGAEVTLRLNSRWVTAEAEFWTADEVRRVDEALATMVARTGNNRLLEQSSGWNQGELTFVRQGNIVDKAAPNNTTGFGGWNDSQGNLHLAEARFASPDPSELHRVVYHEVGHNWDNEGPDWSSFMAISDWQFNGTNWRPPSTDWVQGSFNGTTTGWWYDSSVAPGFARAYGQYSPLEDFATNFARYFLEEQGETWSYTVIGSIAAKQDHLDDMLDSISIA